MTTAKGVTATHTWDPEQARRAVPNLHVTSMFRTTAEQLELRKKWEEGQREGLVAQPAPESPHEAGFSFDVNWNDLTMKQQETLLKLATDTGWRWGGKEFNDPVHFYQEPSAYGYKGRPAAKSENQRYWREQVQGGGRRGGRVKAVA